MNRQELMEKLAKQMASATQIPETPPVPAVIEPVAQVVPVVAEVVVVGEKPFWYSKFEEYAKAHTPENHERDDDDDEDDAPVIGEVSQIAHSATEGDYAAIVTFMSGTGAMNYNLKKLGDTVQFIITMLGLSQASSVTVSIKVNRKGVE